MKTTKIKLDFGWFDGTATRLNAINQILMISFYQACFQTDASFLIISDRNFVWSSSTIFKRNVIFWILKSVEKLMEQLQEVDPEHPVFLRTKMTTEEKLQSLKINQSWNARLKKILTVFNKIISYGVHVFSSRFSAGVTWSLLMHWE